MTKSEMLTMSIEDFQNFSEAKLKEVQTKGPAAVLNCLDRLTYLCKILTMIDSLPEDDHIFSFNKET